MRQDAFNIFQAGIAAADPYQAVKNSLHYKDGQLEILLDINHPSLIRTGQWETVHLIAFGKAACAMAKAARDIIPEDLLAHDSLAVTNYENETIVNDVMVLAACHPLPDQAGLKCATRVADIAENAKKDELVLVLVSGGGSALIPYPAEGVTLEDKIATTELLLSCGATINEVNCVRKHLSQLKGGGLALKAAPADLHALLLSDVMGDDPGSIASGPTVADTTTFQNARQILTSGNIWDRLPKNVSDLLKSGCKGLVPETPKPDNDVFHHTGYTLIGSNKISIKAIISAAENQGYNSELYSEHLCGEARVEADKLAQYAKKMIARGSKKPLALLAGGETTVSLKGNGRGGRNQEMSLAFALAAEKHRLPNCWVFLSGGTDGRDGPTDAAGGLVDPASITRMHNANVDPLKILENNDSYFALQQSNDLLHTGATGTNVADLQIMLLNTIN